MPRAPGAESGARPTRRNRARGHAPAPLEQDSGGASGPADAGRIRAHGTTWEWRLAADDTGARWTLYLHRPDLPSSTMRRTLEGGQHQLTAEQVALHARDPDERTWLDAEGALWLLEPDRKRSAVDGVRFGHLRCREHPPRKRQQIRWTADFTLGTLTEADIEVIIRVAGLQRSAKQWQRIADDMLATGRLSVVSSSTRRIR